MQKTAENTTNSLAIANYVSQKPAQRNKIVLERNFINFLESGEKVLHYADKATVVKASHFAILSSNNCLMTEKLSVDKEYRSTLFFFDNEHISDFFIKYDRLIKGMPSQQEKHEEPFLVFRKDEFIMNIISSLKIIQQKPSRITSQLMQLKFEELMLHLLEQHPHKILSFKTRTQEAYSDIEIRKAVEGNITSNLSLSELAFLCHTSVSTFKRKFIKLYKVTPSQYFLHRKMEIAASLLLQNENPSEVFHKVGYESHSSFSQSFKKIYGISPKQFQQQKMPVSQQLLNG